MGDFLLDFRDLGTRRRSCSLALDRLRFCEDTKVQAFEREAFSLCLGSVDNPDLWGPCSSGADHNSTLVALVGRISLEQDEWEAARHAEGMGGLACRAILGKYRSRGIEAFTQLSGNFVVIVHDPCAGELHLVTDRCGMQLAYGGESGDASWVLGTHPDVVASASGQSNQLDKVSLAEFLTAGSLTFPHSYYGNIKALQPGTIHTFRLDGAKVSQRSTRSYFRFQHKVTPAQSEWELAEDLSRAFRGAIRRRTLPLLGRTAIAMSGGLDSRAVVSAANRSGQLMAFTLFDKENPEVRAARAIAESCQVPWVPLQRDFEYYGNHAEQGVRISGGMGCFASNHFLGLRSRLREEGVENLLTGCYCDYLFKGLALNTVERRFSRKQQMAPFRFEFYRPWYSVAAHYQEGVESRVREKFPEANQQILDEDDWLRVEQKRSFPLAYEGDQAQRVIPQRILPWYLPIVDNELLDVYLRTPLRWKLNASLFSKMLKLLCDENVLRIPDSNIGSPPGGSPIQRAAHRYWSALQNRLSSAVFSGMATRGSWPNWDYYIRNSPVINGLWTRESVTARHVLGEIVGEDPFRKPIEDHGGRRVEWFLRLLTLKIWLEQRD